MKKGQILLITVMLLATVMTVMLSITFQSATETQTTKLEEENQRALAAAEAAIEAALNQNANVVLGQGTLSSLSGFTGEAIISTDQDTSFTSPTIAKDSGYTFYVGEYSITDHSIAASTNQDLTICFTSAPTNPALELTLIKTDEIKKYVVDPSSRIANASSPTSGCTADTAYAYSYTISSADIENNSQILLIRALYNSTRVLISASTNLAIQGKTVVSTAKSAIGVSKKITLFQSYPQLPMEFFTTSF